MSHKVMIGVPSPELETSLTVRFDELSDCEIVSIHRSYAELSETLRSMPDLDVLIVHEDLGPLPAVELIRDVARNHPQLAILLMVEESDPEEFTRVMEAGARGVMLQDCTIGELDARVGHAAEWSQTLRRHFEEANADVPASGRRGSIITLTGAKGGIGTTTLTIQLARAAAQAGRSVCLVDLDLQKGDIPGYLDLNHRRSIVDLVAAADSISGSMLGETLYVHPEGMHILLAPREGERGEEVTETAARQILASLNSRYELVIADCGSYMTDATAMACELAHTCLVTATPDLPALRAGQRLISMWERLQVREKKNVKALLLRHSRQNEIQPDFARKLIGVDLVPTPVPSIFRSLEEASNTGDPRRITDQNLLKAYSKIAAELSILEAPPEPDLVAAHAGPEAEQMPEVPRKKGLFGREKAAKPKKEKKERKKKQKAGDKGGQLIEFAAVTPILILAGLLVWQVVLFGITSMYASHAANEAARQAAVTPDDLGKITGEASKRVRAPWDNTSTFHVEIDHRPDGSYAKAVLAMPVVLPSATSPWDVSGESKIYYER
ncbi:AAA family ATPase [Nocardiopsis sp. RSe5-2]|uniref:AAA family ATPase n=1 Tax=Nocardiopsis endophytica TaxID=3018445 RepID=A0ABT4U2G7_9ACTN|nr:AAA family ATPase [Nocardiopsis endophytica]MDA2811135.1 AAA family ATPase [Nocardiopsis endophytica]